MALFRKRITPDELSRLVLRCCLVAFRGLRDPSGGAFLLQGSTIRPDDLDWKEIYAALHCAGHLPMVPLFRVKNPATCQRLAEATDAALGVPKQNRDPRSGFRPLRRDGR